MKSTSKTGTRIFILILSGRRITKNHPKFTRNTTNAAMDTFPQYRKLQERSFYKIVSENELYEIQRLGKRFLFSHLIAATFLDKNLIQDLLSGDNGRYEKISEVDYKQIEALL